MVAKFSWAGPSLLGMPKKWWLGHIQEGHHCGHSNSPHKFYMYSTFHKTLLRENHKIKRERNYRKIEKLLLTLMLILCLSSVLQSDTYILYFVFVFIDSNYVGRLKMIYWVKLCGTERVSVWIRYEFS